MRSMSVSSPTGLLLRSAFDGPHLCVREIPRPGGGRHIRGPIRATARVKSMARRGLRGHRPANDNTTVSGPAARPGQRRSRVYLDRRLWAFTRSVRWRIAWTVLVGLVATGVGIGRLVLFGWLLARVIAGDPVRALIAPAALTAATILLRGALDYYRNM